MRAAQEARLAAMRRLGGWQRLERRIEGWWTGQRVDRYSARRRTQGTLVAPDGPDALRAAAAQGLVDADALIADAHRIRRREFVVFGVPIPNDGPWPWDTDWRWSHAWPAAYFRSYRHYENPRARPYDVKFPWELCRLGFVPRLAQAAALDPAGGWTDEAAAVVTDWARSNPLAHSVAWDPMEASVRAIALVSTAEMLAAIGGPREVIAGLLPLLAGHGEFISRTVEYTDVRGNHYAANLVALLLLGLTLDQSYPGATAWWRYAARRIVREAELQILPDGVDFEKSLSYHRLVAELFTLGMIAMERTGLAVSPRMRSRLHAACAYSAACTRPDGLAPNVGDNDGARALSFDVADSRDHRELVGLGAILFDDGTLKTIASRLPAAAPWLLGAEGLARWVDLRAAEAPQFSHFPQGGVVVVRRGAGYLWLDVGEVGLAGRGGHGHNDLLSFELVLDGVPIVIDAGCPVYSADLETRNLFRSTAYHNGVRVDRQELAPMSGWWRIGNDAIPGAVETTWDGSTATVQASHSGYERLPDPVRHTRMLTFAPREGVMECIDSLRCRQRHLVERYLHLAPEVVVTRHRRSAWLECKGRAWSLSWLDDAELTLEEGKVSPAYGVTHLASVIVLTNAVYGDTDLRFTLAPVGRSGAPEREVETT
jgi:uncharacterized heparinase superfamily protein